MKLKISRAARDDLAEIGRFGVQRWSRQQAEIYLDRLMAAMLRLPENPLSAPRAADVSPDLRRLVGGSRVVFYRVTEEAVLVVQVLHHSRAAGAMLG